MNTIHIAKRFNNSLMLRNEVKGLSFRIKFLSFIFSKIILDFTDVEFVSRSSAHEFILLQRQFSKIVFTHQSTNVHQMFDIVANYKKPTTKNKLKISTLKELIALKSI
jgi:hypothetical protein